MHIGNQTAFSAVPLMPFMFAGEQRFDAFEFFPDAGPSGPGWTTPELSCRTRSFIRTAAVEWGIRLSVHASLTADPLTVAGLSILEQDIDFAREIGARVVVLHLVPADLGAFAEAVLSLTDSLAPDGITLSLENTVSTGPDDFNTLFGLLRTLDSTRAHHVGMCFDIGHANLHSSTHNDYLAYLDRVSTGVPIVHLHAHENWGDRDTHMTLFTGHAAVDPSGIEGLVRRLVQRKFLGSAILEQWPNPSSLLLTARDRLRAIEETVTLEDRRTSGNGS